MPHLPSLPADGTLVDVYKRFPAIAAAALALNDAIMRQPAPFTPGEREAIAAYVSTINSCLYCQGVHTQAAVGLGLDADDVTAICQLPETPPDPKLAPVLAYVAKLTTSPAELNKTDAQAILDAGWGEEAVSYAAFVAGLYAFMNRIVEGHGVTAPAEKLKENGQRLADIGYAGLAKMLNPTSNT